MRLVENCLFIKDMLYTLTYKLLLNFKVLVVTLQLERFEKAIFFKTIWIILFETLHLLCICMLLLLLWLFLMLNFVFLNFRRSCKALYGQLAKVYCLFNFPFFIIIFSFDRDGKCLCNLCISNSLTGTNQELHNNGNLWMEVIGLISPATVFHYSLTKNRKYMFHLFPFFPIKLSSGNMLLRWSTSTINALTSSTFESFSYLRLFILFPSFSFFVKALRILNRNVFNY